MRELLIGSKKGLFVVRGDGDGPYEVAGRAFGGDVVEYAMRDPRSGRYIAAVTSGFYGPRLMHTMDPLGAWEHAASLAMPQDTGATLERIWVVRVGETEGQLWAGVDPAALFESRDGGLTWSLNRGLWDQPGREDWNPGGGGLCLHSIVTWPGDPQRLGLGISAVGYWRTEDGGQTWSRSTTGIVPRYVPEDVRGTTDAICVHNLHRATLRPERLFMQFHGGVYRSDDEGQTWISIADGLPSDFGFPIVGDPADPDSAFVIPMVADLDRVTVDGRLRVYETRDAGASWTARGDGLPGSDAYLTILRQAFDRDGEGDGLGLWFGATSGEVFGSIDAGRSWFTVARRLAPVTSVRVA
ncbi:MAG: exo-alpha-sialidase [Actinomycetota bacterium]